MVVGKTKEKGLPQFVLKLRALERYDVADKTWIDWSAREDCEITAFLVLIDTKGNSIFHAKDVQKVFEWDGVSLIGLNLLDLENAEVQFEVQDHEYNDKVTVQVANIRGYNDEPGSSIKKLDDDELAQLNAKFGSTLKKLSGGPKVAKADKTTTATTTTSTTTTTDTTSTATITIRTPRPITSTTPTSPCMAGKATDIRTTSTRPTRISAILATATRATAILATTLLATWTTKSTTR